MVAINNKFLLLVLMVATVLGSAQVQFRGQHLRFHAEWLEKFDLIEKQMKYFNEIISQDSVHELEISLPYCQNPQQVLQRFFSKYLKEYKNLTVDLRSCAVGDSGIAQVVKLINPNTKQLSLNFNIVDSTKAIGKVLGEELTRINSQKLSLSLMFGNLGDKGLNEYLLNHKLNPNLKQLTLDFTHNQITWAGLKHFSLYLEQLNAQELKVLNLVFFMNKIEQKGAEMIAQSIQRFTNLQELKLDAYFNNLKEKGTAALTQVIPNFSRLKKLTLNLDMNHIENQGGKHIGQALASLNNLQSLDLGVASKNFGFKGFSHILNGMRNLTKLTSLILRCGVNRVGIKGANLFAEVLSGYDSLRQLQLGFVQNYISDEGIMVILKAINSSAHLETVRVNLGFNDAKGPILRQALSIFQTNKFKNVFFGLSNNQFQDSHVEVAWETLKKILLNCDTSFQFEFLDTGISQETQKKLQHLFDSNLSNCSSKIYVNSQTERAKIQQILDDKNDKAQKKDKQQVQL